MKSTNIERKGKEVKKEELMQLAKDQNDLIFDVENEIIDILTEEYRKEKKGGQSFLDWLDTKDKGYFLKIPLGMAEGGRIISISDYLKHKERPKIKRINLDAVAPGKAISNLTEAELSVVRDLLRRSFGKQD